MAEPWIRVHANLASKPVIWRASEALGVNENEAVGLMVRLWGALSQHADDGDVSDIVDAQIESWAGWRGKRGRFATFVRNAHVDDDGRINEWDDYAGALMTRRAKDRARQADRRVKNREERERLSRGPSAPNPRDSHGDNHADAPRDNPRDVTLASAPARTNETKRDETSSSSPPSGLADRLASDADRAALASLLASVPNAGAVESEIASSIDGMPGHVRVTPEQAGRAIRDYVAASPATWSMRHFRGFLQRATVPPADPPTRTGSGRRPPKPPPQLYDYAPTTGDPKWQD